ncbi:MAG TPA: hypothetical protein DEA96_16655, partial [Leptospiraceae bacterium]|nr:hypothetical protein [Leptospiraceae bacterium]
MIGSSFLQDLTIVSPIVTSVLAIYLLFGSGQRMGRTSLGLCIALLSVVLWGQYLFYSGSTLVLALPFVVFPAGFFVSPLFHSFVMTQIRGKASA